ncbi:hypothetical protein GT039_22585, partial [Streptomyces sp. SID2955]|nr:hypothetical protein [Streptomyces sp. SID2955]
MRNSVSRIRGRSRRWLATGALAGLLLFLSGSPAMPEPTGDAPARG